MSTNGDRGRLFVAASLPDGVRAELARWARLAAVGRLGVRRLEPETLHLTLCFLGDQPLSCVSELAGVLGGAVEAVAGIGELALGAPAWLPPRRPRALAVEIGDPEGALRSLQGLLAADIAATIDWQPGTQRFRPHVTVARMRPAQASGRGSSCRRHNSASPARRSSCWRRTWSARVRGMRSWRASGAGESRGRKAWVSKPAIAPFRPRSGVA